MDVTRIVCLAFPVLLILGCASVNTPTDTPKTNIAIESRLAPRDLAPGDCGLFVWTVDTQKRFILFSQSTEKTGAWFIKGAEMPLAIRQQSGEPADTQYPSVIYTAQDGSDIALALTNREPIIDGTRFKAGTLKLSDPDGFERIIPVVGLSACQPVQSQGF